MSNFSRDRINPMEFIAKSWPNADVSHITFDPAMRASDRDYWVLREGKHDGTMMFTWETIARAIGALVNRETYFKGKDPADWSKVRGIRYRIGMARYLRVHGMVDLPCGRYPGQVERIRIPVQCEFILEEPSHG